VGVLAVEDWTSQTTDNEANDGEDDSRL